MSPSRNEIKSRLSSLLSETLDSCFAKAGFVRRQDSLRFQRAIPSEGSQGLEFAFDKGPRYGAGALAHMLPRLDVVLPPLNQAVMKMVGDDATMVPTPEITFSQQIQNAAPRAVRLQTSDWYLFDDHRFRQCIEAIGEFMQGWSIPFLDRYQSIPDILSGFEREDECLPNDRRFLMYIIAAYLTLDQPHKAMNVLETHLGRPGARREYTKVFDYVREQISLRL